MSANPFKLRDPSSGAKITDYEGSLLIVTPMEYRDTFRTSIGETDVVIADFVIVNEEDPPQSEEYTGSIIFQKVLKGQLRSLAGTGESVLGRLGKRASKTPGKNDAYALIPATDDEHAAAAKYLEAIDHNPFAR